VSLFAASPHKVTQEYYDALAARCEKPDLYPNAMTHEQIMYAAGMQACLALVAATIARAPEKTVNRELKTPE